MDWKWIVGCSVAAFLFAFLDLSLDWNAPPGTRPPVRACAVLFIVGILAGWIASIIKGQEQRIRRLEQQCGQQSNLD
jgi:hypothetical protein